MTVLGFVQDHRQGRDVPLLVQDHGQFSECGTIVSGPRTALVVGSFLTVAPKDFPTIVIIVIVIVVDSSAITVRPWCPCAEGAEIQHITPSVRECFFCLATFPPTGWSSRSSPAKC